MLANKTGNVGAVVAVEPDITALPYLLRNRLEQNCAFYVMAGTVSNVPHVVAGHDYSAITRSARPGEVGRPHIDVPSLERVLGRRVNALLLDCEGCINDVLGDRTMLLDQVELILMEEDNYGRVDYRRRYSKLRSAGFVLI